MPHWMVMLAAVLGGCLLLVAGAFTAGRFLDAFSRRRQRARLHL